MNRYLWIISLLLITGCSHITKFSQYDSKTAISTNKSNAHLIKEAVAVGVVSVGLGSIALGNINRDFKTTEEGWFEKESKYGGMDKLGHAWYSNAIADFFFERNPNKTTQIKSSAALASAVSFGIMSLLEVSDGYADNVVGFSNEDMVANAVGASFSYLRNSLPNLKNLVDYRIEYLPDHSSKDWDIDTFYADQKYLLAWKLSGVDKLKDMPLRFFEVHTGYYARGYSSKEIGNEKQRNVYVGLGVNFSEVFNLGGPKKSRSKQLFKHFLEHIQLPKTNIDSTSL